MDTRQRSRRSQSRADVSWTAWVNAGSRRLRCHTVDLSPSGAKLKPRGEMLPGMAVDVQLHPPAGRALHVSGVVWRIDSDGMAVLFLKNLPVEVAPVKKLPEGGRRVWR